jgi:hypothetical protein
MAKDTQEARASRRERSTRYPGSTLNECIELARQIAARGVDGLPAEAIAASMGYKNIRTHSFSSGLSSARQFGLLALREGGYVVSELGQRLLRANAAADERRARRQAFLEPGLYSELCERFGNKRVPDSAALANWLLHNHQITASAKQAAAEVFLASAREAGVLGEDGILRTNASESAGPQQAAVVAPAFSVDEASAQAQSGDAEFTLLLWGEDAGKSIRVSAPATMSAENYERLLQALRLHVRVRDKA